MYGDDDIYAPIGKGVESMDDAPLIPSPGRSTPSHDDLIKRKNHLEQEFYTHARRADLIEETIQDLERELYAQSQRVNDIGQELEDIDEALGIGVNVVDDEDDAVGFIEDFIEDDDFSYLDDEEIETDAA